MQYWYERMTENGCAVGKLEKSGLKANLACKVARRRRRRGASSGQGYAYALRLARNELHSKIGAVQSRIQREGS